MGSFQGTVLGAFMTLLGWDGSAFQNILVDSDGHLQVDALSAQLITGFATETTLGTVKDRIGALVTPASGSTNKLLTDMLTALELIDDLRGALDSVGTDEIDVNVEATVLPSDAATETSLQGIEDQIPDQLIGYANTWSERDWDLNAAAGDNVLTTTGVPANKLYVVANIMAYDRDNATVAVALTRYTGSAERALVRLAALAAGDSINWSGRLILKEGEVVRGVFAGCTLNDDIFLDVQGWQVTV